MDDLKISSVEDAIRVALKFKYNWWRGQPEKFGTLIPKIFRKPFYYEVLKNFDPSKEFEIIETFKRLSPTLNTKLPSHADRLGWLILMQHFGAPTRLLDWSESILVALFFAVSESNKEDGELWSLFPNELNIKAGIGNIFPLESNEILSFLAGEASHNNPKKLAEGLNLSRIPDKPVAFYPTLGFERMTSQSSVFTIHPRVNLSNSIIDLINEENKLIKYIIPHKTKSKILDDLKTLGISYRTLFQDLESLSKDIILEYSKPLRKLWGQPDLKE